ADLAAFGRYSLTRLRVITYVGMTYRFALTWYGKKARTSRSYSVGCAAVPSPLNCLWLWSSDTSSNDSRRVCESGTAPRREPTRRRTAVSVSPPESSPG